MNRIDIANFLEQVWLDSDIVSPWRDRRLAQEITELVLHPNESNHAECGGVRLCKSDHAKCRGVYIFNAEKNEIESTLNSYIKKIKQRGKHNRHITTSNHQDNSPFKHTLCPLFMSHAEIQLRIFPCIPWAIFSPQITFSSVKPFQLFLNFSLITEF